MLYGDLGGTAGGGPVAKHRSAVFLTGRLPTFVFATQQVKRESIVNILLDR
jgi:hypothetical protein